MHCCFPFRALLYRENAATAHLSLHCTHVQWPRSFRALRRVCHAASLFSTLHNARAHGFRWNCSRLVAARFAFYATSRGTLPEAASSSKRSIATGGLRFRAARCILYTLLSFPSPRSVRARTLPLQAFDALFLDEVLFSNGFPIDDLPPPNSQKQVTAEIVSALKRLQVERAKYPQLLSPFNPRHGHVRCQRVVSLLHGYVHDCATPGSGAAVGETREAVVSCVSHRGTTHFELAQRAGRSLLVCHRRAVSCSCGTSRTRPLAFPPNDAHARPHTSPRFCRPRASSHTQSPRSREARVVRGPSGQSLIPACQCIAAASRTSCRFRGHDAAATSLCLPPSVASLRRLLLTLDLQQLNNISAAELWPQTLARASG